MLKNLISSNKSRLFKIVIILIDILCILTVLELFSRYLIFKKGINLSEIHAKNYQELKKEDPPYQFQLDPLYIYDKHFGKKYNPNNEGIFRGFHYPKSEFRTSIKINGSGFRNSADYEILADKTRIAVLGDSFVEAFQVSEEHSFPKQLEKMLNNRNYPVTVYNFGLNESGTVHEYATFQHEALKIKPHILILAFFPNDLTDNSPYYEHRNPYLKPNYLKIENNKFVILDFGNDIADEKYLYNFRRIIQNNNQSYNKFFKMIKIVSKKFKNIYFLNLLNYIIEVNFKPQTFVDSEFDVYMKDYPDALNESVDLTVFLIDEINKYCIKNDIRFMVLLLPAAEQVFFKNWEKYVSLRGNNLKSDDFDLNRPNSILEKKLMAKDISVLNLLPLFRKLSNRESLYFKYDMHFNENGHEKTAEALVEFLENNKINMNYMNNKE